MEGSQAYRNAVEAGRVIGAAGFDLICGGYGGLMEASCRGCVEGGGKCAGIGLEHFDNPPNRFIGEFSRAKSLGRRLDDFVLKADRFLALPGGIGTVTEVLFVWDLAKSGQTDKVPILLYGKAWTSLLRTLEKEFLIPPEAFADVKLVSGPAQLARDLGRGRETAS